MEVAINTDDPTLLIDLRKRNGRKPDETFQPFFEKLFELVEQYTAEDDRRHSTSGVTNMSQFISIR